MDADKLKELLKNFHGSEYTEGDWGCRSAECCQLCKTRNTEGKSHHWANGLCRSCYRRLSPAHRLYNDLWNNKNSSSKIAKKLTPKKEYKTLELEEIIFAKEDIQTLLERYDFKCAYCRESLQDYDHTLANAFQIEYKDLNDTLTLIPICRKCNCSKKNLIDELKLRRWARERGISYPFNYILSPSKS
jgi:hypothetical protein